MGIRSVSDKAAKRMLLNPAPGVVARKEGKNREVVHRYIDATGVARIQFKTRHDVSLAEWQNWCRTQGPYLDFDNLYLLYNSRAGNWENRDGFPVAHKEDADVYSLEEALEIVRKDNFLYIVKV